MTQILLNIALDELCQLEGIESEVIIDIVEYGIAEPIEGTDNANWVFDTTSVHWIKKAVRLHRDLEIDWIAVALVIDLMQQKEALQREARHYQRQLSRFIDS
jgi:chaperone modulatory protein CbpM